MRKESISWTRSLGPGGGFRRRAAATHGLGPKTRSLCARAGALSFNLSVPAPVIWRAFGTGVPRSLLSELDADDVLAPQLPGADVFVPYQGVSRAGDGGGDRCGQPAVGAADGAVQDRRALNRWASHRPLGSRRRWRGGNLALREQHLPGEPAGQEGDEPYRDEVPAASVHAGAFYNAGVSAAPIRWMNRRGRAGRPRRSHRERPSAQQGQAHRGRAEGKVASQGPAYARAAQPGCEQ